MHRLFPSLLGRIKTWKGPYVIQPAIRLESKVQKGKPKKIATVGSEIQQGVTFATILKANGGTGG